MKISKCPMNNGKGYDYINLITYNHYTLDNFTICAYEHLPEELIKIFIDIYNIFEVFSSNGCCTELVSLDCSFYIRLISNNIEIIDSSCVSLIKSANVNDLINVLDKIILRR